MNIINICCIVIIYTPKSRGFMSDYLVQCIERLGNQVVRHGSQNPIPIGGEWLNITSVLLANKGKEEVLRICRALNRSSSIYLAEPAFYMLHEIERVPSGSGPADGMDSFVQAKENLKTLTPEDVDCDDSTLLVTMKMDVVVKRHTYSIDSFPNLGVQKIETITVNDPGINALLLLTLDKHDVQNILDVCNALNERDDVVLAAPNFLMHIPEDITEPITTEEMTTEAIEMTTELQTDAGLSTADSTTISQTTDNNQNGAIATGENSSVFTLVWLIIATVMAALLLKLRKANET